MRNSRNELWFVTDVGPDVQHNEELVYHRFDGTRWAEAATLNQMPGIQQNVASVMCGDRIYSYGISVREPLYVEECVFDTTHTNAAMCAPIQIDGKKLLLPPSCNYVGASISPSGKKIVWWTTVGVNGGEGKWNYIYEGAHGWVGPIVSTLNGLNDFGYVFASFLADDVIAIAGQLYQGAYPHGSFVLGAAEFRFGDKLDLARNFHAFSTNNPNSGKSAADVWVYKGNTHVIAETQKGTLAYYFKPAKKSWADCDAPVCVLTNVHRARFAEDERHLRLITGSVDGNALMVRTISKAKCNAPINWPFVKGDNVPVPERLFAQPSAVYSESRGYQTTHVVGSSFAIVGHYPEADAKILQVTLSH